MQVPPRRTADPVEALRLLTTDGCVIVEGAGRSSADAVHVARRVFGAAALEIPEPAAVRDGGDRDRKPDGIDHTTPLTPHTDGFSYGDRYPDHILLLCVTASATGGESFLVDGYAVLDRLRVERPDLVERLRSVPIDQTEPDMRVSLTPIVGATPAGRTMLRLFPFQRPSPTSTDPAADLEMISAWRGAVTEAAASAARFRLGPGDAVFVDNYRMLHGRESYDDLDRLLWRVWVWTTDGLGVPSGQLHSDSRYAITP